MSVLGLKKQQHCLAFINPVSFNLFQETEYLEISSIRDARTGKYSKIPRVSDSVLCDFIPF